MIARLAHIACLVIYLALVVASVVLYDDLPARIPQHFDIGGNVDRWVDRSWGSWLLLPIVATVLTALLYGIAAIIPNDLRQLNMPAKEKLLALPQSEQRRAVAIVRTALYWIAALVLLTFLGLQLTVWRAAVHTTDGITLLGVATAAPILLVFVVVYLMTVRIRRIAEGGA